VKCVQLEKFAKFPRGQLHSRFLQVMSDLQQVPVVDLHAAVGALVLGRRRRAETGGLRRAGLTGLLLHLRLRLRQRHIVYQI